MDEPKLVPVYYDNQKGMKRLVGNAMVFQSGQSIMVDIRFTDPEFKEALNNGDTDSFSIGPSATFEASRLGRILPRCGGDNLDPC